MTDFRDDFPVATELDYATALIKANREIDRLTGQRNLLWNKAQRVLNKSNSADDTWVEIPKSCLDELGQALLMTSGRDNEEETHDTLG